MKNAFALLCLLTILSCQKSPDRGYKTIVVKSIGEVEALPDQASFHISLYCIDPSVKASKNCLVAKSNELMAQLQSFGIGKKDIKTTSVDLQKTYSWRNNSNVFDGYRSSTTLIVTVKKIAALDNIYTALLDNRNLEIGTLSYSHSDIDSLHNEAYVQALAKSSKLADKLLEKLPEDKKEVIQISNIEISAQMPRSRHTVDAVVAEQGAASNQSIGMSTGVAKVSATLYVEYEIR